MINNELDILKTIYNIKQNQGPHAFVSSNNLKLFEAGEISASIYLVISRKYFRKTQICIQNCKYIWHKALINRNLWL